MNSLPAILIVDDELIILETLKMQLERAFENEIILEACSSVEEANDIIIDLVNNNVNLVAVITDFNLGQLKGTDIIRKANETFPNSKKAILTGMADFVSIENMVKEIKLHAFFNKPWDIYLLIEFVKESIKSTDSASC